MRPQIPKPSKRPSVSGNGIARFLSQCAGRVVLLPPAHALSANTGGCGRIVPMAMQRHCRSADLAQADPPGHSCGRCARGSAYYRLPMHGRQLQIAVVETMPVAMQQRHSPRCGLAAGAFPSPLPVPAGRSRPDGKRGPHGGHRGGGGTPNRPAGRGGRPSTIPGFSDSAGQRTQLGALAHPRRLSEAP